VLDVGRSLIGRSEVAYSKRHGASVDKVLSKALAGLVSGVEGFPPSGSGLLGDLGAPRGAEGDSARLAASGL
jgi:hypothetical protein